MSNSSMRRLLRQNTQRNLILSRAQTSHILRTYIAHAHTQTNTHSLSHTHSPTHQDPRLVLGPLYEGEGEGPHGLWTRMPSKL